MGILGAAAEAPIRAQFEILMPDRCTVRRVTQPLTGGAWTDTETDYAVGVPCRVDKDQRYDREQSEAGRLTAESSYIVVLSTVAARWPGSVGESIAPGTVDIRPNDTLVVTGDGAGTYQPIGSGGPVTDEYVRSVRCNKVE